MYYNKSQCWISISCKFFFFRGGAQSPQWAMASSFTRFLDHTQRHTTVCRTPLDEWSARHRDLYLTTHNTHNRHTSMLRWDSNPQSQQASGRRHTPQTARPLGPANNLYLLATLAAAVTVRHGTRTTDTAASNEIKTHDERVSKRRTLDLSVNKFNVMHFHM